MSHRQRWGLSREQVEIVARRGRTLDEALAAASAPPWPAAGVAAAGAEGGPLHAWRRAFARGDEAAFARRLAWDGFDEAFVRGALARPGGAGEPLPSWLATLGEVLSSYPAVVSALLRGDHPLELEGFPPGQVPPFAELWIPFVRHAVRRLGERTAQASDLLAAGATAALERHLLAQLCEAAALACYERFDSYRRAVVMPITQGEGEPRRELYRRFIARMFGGEIVPFLLEFSVLARQLCRFVETWVESIVEFLLRLEVDHSELQARFAPAGELGRVAALQGGLSDRHNAGRAVLAVTFEMGARIIYKPRPLELEAAFNHLLAWLAERGLEPAPATLQTLTRLGYGWVEFAEQAAAASDEEVRDYFRRAGALVCVAWLLNGRDLHMDNVVASKRGPVLVDTEMLVQPILDLPGDPGRDTTARGTAAGALERSCLSTGLLSFLQMDAGGRMWDVGGLCGRGGFPVPGGKRVWLDVNSDPMRPTREPLLAPARQNMLFRDGRPQAPEAHLDELTEGFREAYRCLLRHRRGLLGESSPLAALAGVRTRILLRPTNLYASLLVRLATPEFQREGTFRSFAIDSLNGVFRGEIGRPALWPLAGQERCALDDHDIPYFGVSTDAREIVPETGERIEGVVRESGIEVVRGRLAALSEEDLAAQLELLRSWRLSALLDEDTGMFAEVAESGQAAREPAAGLPASGPETASRLLEVAGGIAREITARAVRGEDGTLTWLAPGFLRPGPDADPAAHFYLYNGAVGIALFLAAQARVSEDDAQRDAAWRACSPIAAALDTAARTPATRVQGIGACHGVGGVVYGLAVIAGLLDDTRFAELAARTAPLIDADRIAADRHLDVAGGTAGAILGLLALHRLSGDAAVLERALACGRHVLAQQQPGPQGGAAWPGPDGLMLAGFAHGAAGIGYALARLYADTGVEAFRTAWREAFAYERTLFSREAGNWMVLHRGEPGSPRPPLFMTAWCHGAPGIALARLCVLDMGSDECAREELEVALATTIAAGVGPVDHLCCGNLGRGDILIKAGEVMESGALFHAGGRIAAAAVRAAGASGGFRLRQAGEESRVFAPSFFRGTAGIGYALLRLARPGLLPCVLSFDPVPGGAGQGARS